MGQFFSGLFDENNENKRKTIVHYIPGHPEVHPAHKIDSEEIINCCADLGFGLFVVCCTDEEFVHTAPAGDKGPYVLPKPSILPFSFDHGRIVIKKITASNIKSVEFVGKNDLYLNCFFGEWSQRTKVLSNCGANGIWSDLGSLFIIATDPNHLKKHNLSVQCLDKNSIRNDVLIGEGSISMALLATIGFNREQIFDIKLFDKSGKHQTGTISFYVYLAPK